MIVLDTDVLSGTIKAEKDYEVIAWLDEQNPEELCTTAITILEIWTGIEELPFTGRRRNALEISLGIALGGLLSNRILPFDSASAEEAGHLYGLRRRAGRTIGQPDTQIAGIVRTRGATLATRNVRDFADAGIPLINPWNVT